MIEFEHHETPALANIEAAHVRGDEENDSAYPKIRDFPWARSQHERESILDSQRAIQVLLPQLPTKKRRYSASQHSGGTPVLTSPREGPMKHRWLLAAGALAFAIGATNAQAEDKKINLKLSYWVPPSHLLTPG
jgi:hypothetical protein